MKLYFYVQRRNSEMKRGISSLFKTKILLESSTKFTSAKNSWNAYKIWSFVIVYGF